MKASNPTSRFLRAVAMACSLVAPGAVADDCGEANSEALSWLDRMSRSIHEVSYYGVATLWRGGATQALQVSHVVDGNRVEESLTRLSGQGARVVRMDHPLACIHPGHKLLRIGETLSAGDCGIAGHYSFTVNPGERIAGRSSVLIHVQPRDMYRFGYLLSLDEATGLMLRTDTVGFGGKVLETFQFVSLSYEGPLTAVPPVDTLHRAEHPAPGDSAPKATVDRPWAVTWVPPGFTKTDTPLASDERRTYTDGLAVFSVFMERLGRGMSSGEGLVHNGATTAYSRGMMLDGEQVLITVVGDVPVNTSRRVTEKVVWMQ